MAFALVTESRDNSYGVLPIMSKPQIYMHFPVVFLESGAGAAPGNMTREAVGVVVEAHMTGVQIWSLVRCQLGSSHSDQVAPRNYRSFTCSGRSRRRQELLDSRDHFQHGMFFKLRDALQMILHAEALLSTASW